MSMTGSGGEENSLEPSSSAFSDGASSHISPVISGGTPKCAMSPLLRIFSSKEVVPKILDYEKALLVMKEHDYAKAVERSAVLKLSSLLPEPLPLCEDAEQTLRPLDSIADIDTLLNTRKDLLLVRESATNKADNVVSSHLREVVGMQIELIREQQEQLHGKDKELNTVRKDKEQLQARMERMERRLAILQKRSKQDQSDSEPLQQNTENTSLIETTSTPRMRTHRDTVINSEKHFHSQSDHVSRTGRSSRVSSRSGTPVLQDIYEPSSGSSKRITKRKLSDDVGLEVSTKKRRSRQSDMRTRLEYTGLNLPLPHQQYDGYVTFDRLVNHSGGGARRYSTDFTNSVASSSISGCSGMDEKAVMNGAMNTTILVPSWKTSTAMSKTNSVEEEEECEDLSDDYFTRRHRKPEEDEKRRKRWDMQRARALRNHEELLRKYNQKGGGGEKPEKKKEKFTTFSPKLSEVETIEIKDTVPVTAFGVPVPIMKPKEFELSWFDLDARDAQDRVRTTRSRAKASNNRLSVGSSADEDFK